MWEQTDQDLIKLFPTKCHNTGTFPAVHGLQHPLVVAVIWRHPLPAKAVRGEIPVPLLLRGHCRRLSGHKIIFLNDKISAVIFPFAFYLYLSLQNYSWSQSKQSCGHNPLSVSQSYDFFSLLLLLLFLLAPSLGSSLPFSFLPMRFFSLPFSSFSAAHSVPANGACGLWRLGLSLCVMCNCALAVALVCRRHSTH